MVVELKRDADHVEAVALQETRDHGGIDAARHGDDDARLVGGFGKIEGVHHEGPQPPARELPGCTARL
jgi:hypothetical protein